MIIFMLARRIEAPFLLPGLFVALVALCAMPGGAQQQAPRFVQLTREQNLSHNTVEAIVEDHRGFMWFGTADGLNRYDAYSFTVYRNDPEDPRSLSGNYVMALLEDRERSLWVGTLDGLNRYDRQTDSFIRYRSDELDPSTLNHDSVFSLYEDRAGELWIGTDRGLNRFDRATETFVGHTWDVHNLPRKPDSQRVRAILEDRQGNLWIGTVGHGLHRFDRRSGKFETFLRDKDHGASLSNHHVSSLFEDRQGHLWVGTLGGLHRFDRAENTFVRFNHDAGDPRGLSNDYIEAIYEDREGNLWIGTDWGGLKVLDRQTGTFFHHRHDPSDASSLASDAVRAIYEDSKGDLWIGTYKGGVSFYNRNHAAFTYYQHLTNDPNSLSHSAVVCFFEDQEGLFWIGTEGGLNSFDRATKTFNRYLHDGSDPTSLSANAVLSVLRDSRGHLWVGTFHGGLNRMDPEKGTFLHYQHDASDPQSLGNNHVWHTFEDSTGRLWLGTFNGVNRFEYDSETFVRYEHDSADDRSIGSDIVWRLYEDKSGILWLATTGGLSVYDRVEDRFRTYRHDGEDRASLSHGNVLAILEDREGTLWIGTEGGGLNRFDRDSEMFTAFRTADGLPNDVVYGILEDAAGRLWISTNEGLSRFDPRTETFVNYDKGDGLLAYPFSRNAYLKSRGGEIFFGGTHGFISFDPDQVRDNTYIPPVVLTDFQIFNRPAASGSRDSPLERHITVAESVRLRYDQSVISLAFSALNYRAPEKNRYAYKLENFDKDWTYVRTQRTATYTNLNPGSYTFRVRASNNSGLWNESGTSIEIVVAPPYWATWWFRAASVLAAIAMLLGGYLARTRSIRARNKALRAEIAERRRLEEDRERLLLEMEAKNEELERFTYTVSHDLKAPLITIRGFLGLLEKDAESGKTDQVKKDIRHINSAALQMHSLLAELLELSRVGRVVSSPEAVALTDLAHEAATSAAGLIQERGVAVEIEPGMPAALVDRTRVLEVFQNLLVNAVQYMGEQAEPRIEVSAGVQGEEVLCRVRDNGMGIDPKYHEKVFVLFERLAGDGEGTGIGLALVKRIVEVHGGRIWIESQGAGQGSSFCFTLPGAN